MRGRSFRRSMKNKKDRRLWEIAAIYGVTSSVYVDWDFVDGLYLPVGKYVKRRRHTSCRKFVKKQNIYNYIHSDISTKGNLYRKFQDQRWTKYR